MIKSVISKIKSNIWMFICLIVGSLLITGVLASVPMYTMGTLRQMLSTDLKAYEREEKRPSGQLYFWGKIPNGEFRSERGKKLEQMENKVIGGLSSTSVKLKNSYAQFYAGDLQPQKGTDSFLRDRSWSVSTLKGLDDNVFISEGEMYSNYPVGDAIEVIIKKSVFDKNPSLELGKKYTFIYKVNKDEYVVKIIPVGVFEVNDEKAPFWYDTTSMFDFNVFCAETAFKEYFFETDRAICLTGAYVYANLDFTDSGLESLNSFIDYYNGLSKYANELGSGRHELIFPAGEKINNYISQIANMQMSLWILNVPVIAMLAFYMIMVTRMIIEEDRNEISTFKSRGAKTSQIFLRYVIESGFISVFALILGPPIGFFLAKTVGNASGFLEFNAREKMPVKIDGMAYVYAIVACLFFSALILIPAIMATRGTIVNLKQRRARKRRFSWWEKACVDIICLVVAIGLLIIYQRNNGFNREGTVDPIVYVISSLFILGAGLLFLRIYPFLIAIIFKITKRIMPPSGYAAFVQVSRGGNDYRFLMLFLVMTISIGIYGSASARIINNNVENTVKFKNGADVIIHPDFTDYEPYDSGGNYIPAIYRTFPVETVAENEYVEAVSRVEIAGDVKLFAGNMPLSASRKSDENSVLADTRDVKLMAIDPYEYGHIGWCAKSLNGASFNEILNILELSPMSVFISEAMAEEFELEPGDAFEIDVNESNKYNGSSEYQIYESWPRAKCYVAGILKYWPVMGDGSYKTDQVTVGDGKKYNKPVGQFYIIMNYEYLNSIRSTNEFDLYLKLTDSATKGYDRFVEQALDTGLIDNATQIKLYGPDIMEGAKSDSMLKGLNGSYSIGFVSTLTVAFVGFLIYWLMNVRNRKLQFGILRAMGLTKNKLTLMLLFEHLLTTGVSVLVGIVVGALTVRFYAPLLKIAYTGSVLPLEIVFNRADNLKIYAVVLAMLISGIVILSIFIRKLKINEAVKIGEE